MRPLTALVAGVFVALALVRTGAAAGEKYVAYGADTTEAERQELGRLFGVDGATKTALVTTAEVNSALQGSGLPTAATDKSISSSALTCLNKGDGLTVRTQNITALSAPVYANALVTAGVGDGNVLIAAPAANPVTGETALVGVLKTFPQCQVGAGPDPARVSLAYEQIARTVALAGPGNNLNKAAATMLAAAQPVILGQAKDDATVGAALDSAAGAQGITVSPAQRAPLVAFLRKLGGLDFGAYAKGYTVQQVSPTEVRVTPAGAGAPNAAAGAASPAPNAAAGGAASPGTNGAAPGASPSGAALNPAGTGAFTGDITKIGTPLTVRSNGVDRPLNAAPDVQVTRNGKAATLADLQPNDRVSVTTRPDGAAQRIDATSDSGGSNIWKWLLPLLLLALLAGLAYFFLGRRRKDSFVLEPKNAAGSAAPPRDDQPRG